MRLLHRVPAVLRALFVSPRIDADLAEEMRFHVEREIQANVARGMTPEAARRAARLVFGSIDAAHETSRDDRPGASLRGLTRDARFGIRLAAKSPTFALTAIAIIALGIGASTAVFSVVHGVMLQPLPYRSPDRLVSIWLLRGMGRNFPSAADAHELRQLRSVFDDVALVRSSTNLNLVVGGEPYRLFGARVSPNLFSVLGTPAALGRTFVAGEDQPGRERVVILSDALWRSRFGADSGILDRRIRLEGGSYTVVGVMGPEIQYPSTGVEAWIPAVIEPGELSRERINNYRLVARLAPGLNVERARAEVAALAARLGSAYAWNRGAGMSVDSMLDDAVRDVRATLRILLGAVLVLLIIACVNLSSLFGARARVRRGEFAVRLALGATRKRLISQSIAESAPLVVVGGMLGVGVAAWAIRAFVAGAPAGLPRLESIAVSAPVLLFSFGLLLVTAMAAGVAPALQASRSDFTSITKDGGRGATAGRASAMARRAGVAVQIACALPLLAGAGLLIRSALNVMRVEPGFDPGHVATFAFEVSRTKYVSAQEAADYYTRLIQTVRALPGVTSTGIGNRIPLSGAQTNPVYIEKPTNPADTLINADSRTVSGDYFAALGIRLLEGRTFTDGDDASASAVGIVDERVARRIWPGQSPLGKRLHGPGGDWVTVVGVVAHVRSDGLEVDPRPQVYWSYRQWTQNRATLAVRCSCDPRVLAAPVIRAIRAVDNEQSVFDVRTMEEVVARSQSQRRMTTALMAGFSAMALLLAAVGIYGVVAYGVTQRRREFGIRLALGATRREVTRLVVWNGTSMAIAGTAIGIVLASAAAGAMSNLVYGVEPRDVASTLGATVALLFVAIVASYIPARRAAAVDPGVTLRAE